MNKYLKLLVLVVTVTILLTGCRDDKDASSPEKMQMTSSTFVRQISIKETTVASLSNGVRIGFQGVFKGTYKDIANQEHFGTIAQLGISDGVSPQAVYLEVGEGAIFEAGGVRYQVLEINANTTLVPKPGSSNGYITLGQLP